MGNTQVFGELSSEKYATAGLGSRTRGVFAGGYNGGQTNNIEFVSFSSLGNTTDFGDMTYAARDMGGGVSNDIRGLFYGGIATPSAPGGTDTINYITIASTGNGVDYGNLYAGVEAASGCASSTRGIIAGGSNPCLLYTSPSPRDKRQSRMPSSA